MTTLEALDDSIRHWKEYAKGNGALEGFPAINTCALCRLFFPTCKHCPVKEKTGLVVCAGSPYSLAIDALKLGYTSPEFMSAAQKMVDFLEDIKNNPLQS